MVPSGMDDTDDPNRKAWNYFWMMVVGLFVILAAVHVIHL